MNKEVREGKASYSTLQMLAVPLNGGFEVISEIPTLSILKKEVVMEAAVQNEELIKKKAEKKFSRVMLKIL
jgi:hypothetical protein